MQACREDRQCRCDCDIALDQCVDEFSYSRIVQVHQPDSISALVVLLALLASTLGACLGYWIGRNGGRVLLQKARVSPQRLQRVEDFFSRYGSFLVLLSRFVDGFRQLTPIVAGSMGMSWWRFFVATFVGSVLWVSVWGIGVYLLGLERNPDDALLHNGLGHWLALAGETWGAACCDPAGWPPGPVLRRGP